jgi:hypothetical protein
VAVNASARARRRLTQRQIAGHRPIPAQAGDRLVLGAGAAAGQGGGRQIAGARRLSGPTVAGFEAAGSNLLHCRTGGGVAAAATAGVEDLFLANLISCNMDSQSSPGMTIYNSEKNKKVILHDGLMHHFLHLFYS